MCQPHAYTYVHYKWPLTLTPSGAPGKMRLPAVQAWPDSRVTQTLEVLKMKRSIALVTVLLFSAVGLAAEKAPWPQFRGPNGSGVAEGQKPPVELGPERNVKWKVPAPSGLS